MTDAELAAIKKRVDAAAPGEWFWSAQRGQLTFRTLASEALNANDREFVVHARDDVAALLAEVEVLKRIIGDQREERGFDRRTYEQGLEDGRKDGLRQLREVEAKVQECLDKLPNNPAGPLGIDHHRVVLSGILGCVHGIIDRDYPTAIYGREAKGTA